MISKVAATLFLAAYVVLAGCALTPAVPRTEQASQAASETGQDIVLYALGLIDTGYRYGGKNPQAGMDCSGMVTHVYQQAAGIKLTGSAADMARIGRPIEIGALRPGDLVFFNTLGPSFSHVGIYIGGDRFVHAPKTNGKVRTEHLKTGYFGARFSGARTYFN